MRSLSGGCAGRSHGTASPPCRSVRPTRSDFGAAGRRRCSRSAASTATEQRSAIFSASSGTSALVPRPRSAGTSQPSCAQAIASWPLAAEGLVLQLLSTAVRAEPQAPRRACWVRDARDLLHASAPEAPTLSEVATAVGVHPSHLARAFRREYGLTVGAVCPSAPAGLGDDAVGAAGGHARRDRRRRRLCRPEPLHARLPRLHGRDPGPLPGASCAAEGRSLSPPSGAVPSPPDEPEGCRCPGRRGRERAGGPRSTARRCRGRRRRSWRTCPAVASAPGSPLSCTWNHMSSPIRLARELSSITPPTHARLPLDEGAVERALHRQLDAVAHLGVVEPAVGAPVRVRAHIERERVDHERRARRGAAHAIATARRGDDAVRAARCRSGQHRGERQGEDRDEDRSTHSGPPGLVGPPNVGGEPSCVLNRSDVWNASSGPVRKGQ